MVPLSLEIEHCAPKQSYSHLNMARALCTQDGLPGLFEIVRGATKRNKYAVLKLNHFCFICVVVGRGPVKPLQHSPCGLLLA